MPPLQNDLNNKGQQPKKCSPNSTSVVPRPNATIKFRSHQHNNRLRSRENSKSAWALASPRFTGDTKYHEAMMGGDEREMMTPGRMDQRRRSTGTAAIRNLKRPQTCFETRRRYTYGHEGRESLPPALEVTIPSFETEAESELSNPMLNKKEVSTTGSPLEMTIISPPRRRRLEDDYFDNIRASLSLTDSGSCSSRIASSQPNSEDRKLRSEQLAKRRQTLWESQELQSLSSYDSEIESMLWDSSSNNGHICRDDGRVIESKNDNDLDDHLDVESCSSFDHTKSTDGSIHKSPSGPVLDYRYVQTLECTVEMLNRELEEKDKIIEMLKLTLDQRADNDSTEEYESEDTVSSNPYLNLLL